MNIINSIKKYLKINLTLTKSCPTSGEYYINTILLSKLSNDNISNGYKISLSFIYPFLCFVSIVLAFLSPDKLKDNYYVIGFILLMLIEVSLYLIAKNIKTINTNK